MKNKLIIMIVAAVLFVPTFLLSQPFTRIYRSSSATKELAFYALTPATGGGYFATGQGVGDFQISVARFAPFGNLLWAKMPDEKRGIGQIVSLQNGGVMIFGNNQSFQSYFDASALHLDASGNVIDEIIWGKESDIDSWLAAERFSNNEVLAIGNTLTEELFVDQLLMVKFSSTGDVIWEKSFGGAFSDIIEIPNNAGFYLAGSNLARFDADGEPVWGKSYDFGGADIGFFNGILCPDGSLLFVGWDRRTSFANEHLLLFKTDANGAPLWVKSFDGSNNIGAINIHLLNSTTAVVTATTSTQLFPILDNDNLILQFSLDGNLQSSMAFGSGTKDFPYDSFLDGTNLVVCGLTNDAGGTDSTRAYISQSKLNTSDCTKDFPITIASAPDLPLVSDLAFDPYDVTVKTTYNAAVNDLLLSETVTCGTVSTQSGQSPCDQLSAVRFSSLNAALQLAQGLSDQVSLRVFDVSGKLVFDMKNTSPSSNIILEIPLVPGLFFYTLYFQACGTDHQITGKVTRF